MEPLDGWTGGVPGAQMCVHVYGRRVSVVDVRVLCACARGERLMGVMNIIISRKASESKLSAPRPSKGGTNFFWRIECSSPVHGRHSPRIGTSIKDAPHHGQNRGILYPAYHCS